MQRNCFVDCAIQLMIAVLKKSTGFKSEAELRIDYQSNIQ